MGRGAKRTSSRRTKNSNNSGSIDLHNSTTETTAEGAAEAETTAAESTVTTSNKRAKRATTTTTSTTKDKKDNTMFSSSSKKGKAAAAAAAAAAKNKQQQQQQPQLSTEAAIEKLFQEFADADDPTIISMEGISKLCEQLDIDALEDVRVLVLVWKLVDGTSSSSTEKPGQISKQEFTTGCSRLHVTSVDKLKTVVVPTLDTGFLDQKEFREFYKFCFQFNRQGTHRTLEQDMVITLLQLVLKDRVSAERLTTFCAFLEQSSTPTTTTTTTTTTSATTIASNSSSSGGGGGAYSRITLDQWTSFLDFCYEYDDDLSTYDESTSAWPVMMDEYVEYMMKKGATGQSK